MLKAATPAAIAPRRRVQSWVVLWGRPTGYTVTDAEGRYVLCGYWDDYGQTVRVSKDRYRTSFQEIGGSWQNDFVIIRE